MMAAFSYEPWERTRRSMGRPDRRRIPGSQQHRGKADHCSANRDREIATAREAMGNLPSGAWFT